MLLNRKRLAFLLLSLIPTSLLFVWFLYWDFDLVDDAYIPMTYARNVAAGYGIVFSPGGEPVEGYTSPLWMFWLALMALFHCSLPVVSKYSSLVSTVGLLLVTSLVYKKVYHTSQEQSPFHSLFWPFAAGIALVCDIAVPAYAVSGMETMTYSWVLLLLCVAVIEKWPDLSVCLLMLIVALIRPEGPAFWFLIGACWYFQKKCNRSLLLLVLLTVIFPYGLFLLFRVYTFGVPFPNTFYAKHDYGGLSLMGRGWEYVYYFFRSHPLFLLALFGVLLDVKHRWKSVIIFAFVLLQTVLVIMEGGDHFTLYRFMIPSLAFFSILSIRGLHLCIEKLILEKQHEVSYVKQILVHFIIVITVLVILPAHGAQLAEFSTDTPCNFAQGAKYHQSVVQWTRSWVKVGIWLKEKYPPDTRIAVINAGAIPFYCELQCIDMLGLNDRVIAHTPLRYETLCLPGHDKSNADYVLKQNPQMIQLFPLLFFTSKPYPEDKLNEMLTYPAQMDMWQDERFRRRYDYKTEETRFGFISYFERNSNDSG